MEVRERTRSKDGGSVDGASKTFKESLKREIGREIDRHRERERGVGVQSKRDGLKVTQIEKETEHDREREREIQHRGTAKERKRRIDGEKDRWAEGERDIERDITREGHKEGHNERGT